MTISLDNIYPLIVPANYYAKGNVSFVSKTQLIDHYTKTLGAMHFGGHIMIIDTPAALRLIDKYFKNQEQ